MFDLNEAKDIFDEFITAFDKHYDNQTEYELRLTIFTKNLADVNKRNKYSSTEIYGITQFLDMTTEEFIRDYTGLNLEATDGSDEKDDLQPFKMSLKSVPEHWDWRKQGVITPVRHQGPCGSCWAFSAVGESSTIINFTTGREQKYCIKIFN